MGKRRKVFSGLRAPQLGRQHDKFRLRLRRIYLVPLLDQFCKVALHKVAIRIKSMHLCVLFTPTLPQPRFKCRPFLLAAFCRFDVSPQRWDVDIGRGDLSDSGDVGRGIACNGGCDARHGKVDVDGGWWDALHKDGAERVKVLPIACWWHAGVSDGEIDQPQVVHLLGQCAKAEKQAGGTGQQQVFEVLDACFLGKFGRDRSGLARNKRAFGEDEKQQFFRRVCRSCGGRLGGRRFVVLRCNLAKLFSKLRLVTRPIASQENESVELHTPSDKGNPLEALFQDDQDAVCQISVVGKTPKIQPIGIHLMVRHPNGSTWQVNRHNPAGLLVAMYKWLWIQVSAFAIADRNDQLRRSEELRDEQQRSTEGQL